MHSVCQHCNHFKWQWGHRRHPSHHPQNSVILQYWFLVPWTPSLSCSLSHNSASCLHEPDNPRCLIQVKSYNAFPFVIGIKSPRLILELLTSRIALSFLHVAAYQNFPYPIVRQIAILAVPVPLPFWISQHTLGFFSTLWTLLTMLPWLWTYTLLSNFWVCAQKQSC